MVIKKLKPNLLTKLHVNCILCNFITGFSPKLFSFQVNFLGKSDQLEYGLLLKQLL